MISDLDEVKWSYLLEPTFQVLNTAGKPLTDGYIEVYIHGTRNKYYCAKDFDGTLHEFKIPLDSLGSNIVLASPAHAYDVYVYNKFGSLVMSRYNIVPSTGDGSVIKDVVTIKSEDGTVSVESQDQTNWNLSIKDTVAGIESSLTNKKDKQPTKEFNGSATKTIKNITQNANGELNVEFTNIAGGGGPIYVAHDGTMTGDGTDEMPLSIQSVLDVSNANIAPKYDHTATYPKVGTLCTYDNVLYRSKVAINEAEGWNKEHWDIDSVAAELSNTITNVGTWEDISSEFTPTSIITHINRIVVKINREIGLIYFSIDVNGNFYRDSSVIQILFTKSAEISDLRFDAQYGIYLNSSGKYEMPYQLSCSVQGIRGWLPESGNRSNYILVTGVTPFSM